MSAITKHTLGTIIEILVDGSAWVSLPKSIMPQPGQYLQGWSQADPISPLPISMFPGGIDWRTIPEDPQSHDVNRELVHIAPPLPTNWGIGTNVNLRGPFGEGFRIPDTVRRLSIISLGNRADVLLPLIQSVLETQGAVAFFSDDVLPQLPMAVEAFPLSAVSELHNWPDYIALELLYEQLPSLRAIFGLNTNDKIGVPAYVLVNIPMPCAGVADCGVCTVEGRFSNYLACEDGPVFDLDRLDW